MQASIRGKLIKPGRAVTGGFILAAEFWKWAYEWLPKFVGKKVEITIKELEEGGGGN